MLCLPVAVSSQHCELLLLLLTFSVARFLFVSPLRYHLSTSSPKREEKKKGMRKERREREKKTGRVGWEGEED